MEPTATPSENIDAFETLIRELNHRVWEVRRDACEELGTMGDQRAVHHLVRILGDGVGGVRFAAAEALGKLGDRSAVPALLALLDDPQFGAYGPVIESLANLKSQEAIPFFIRFLSDQDPRTRGLAANALMVMTRQFIGFKAMGTEEERSGAIQKWEAWWEKQKQLMVKK